MRINTCQHSGSARFNEAYINALSNSLSGLFAGQTQNHRLSMIQMLELLVSRGDQSNVASFGDSRSILDAVLDLAISDEDDDVCRAAAKVLLTFSEKGTSFLLADGVI